MGGRLLLVSVAFITNKRTVYRQRILLAKELWGDVDACNVSLYLLYCDYESIIAQINMVAQQYRQYTS